MEPIYEAIKLLSDFSYITQSDLRIAYIIIIEIIKLKLIADLSIMQSLIANILKDKISNY